MSTVPPALTPQQVRDAIDAALAGGVVDVWPHCARRLRERGADRFDLRSCLSTGTMTRAEWHTASGEWRYRIEGVDLDGDDLTVITIIVRVGCIMAVTAF